MNLSEIISSKLENNFEDLSRQFCLNNKHTSTKCFILDDLLPEEITTEIYNNFPSSAENYFFRDTFREKKYTFAKLNTLSNSIVEDITDSFQMKNVVNLVAKISKINGLEADPALYAGGISRMDSGHFLNPHIDNSHDGSRKRYRRLNLLFYVTPNIDATDGGNLELWDKDVKKPLKIPAKFNRLVVMETGKNTWHSVDPIVGNIKRCCVSSYFFSNNSPEDYDYYHVTSFTGRPEQKLKRCYGAIDNFLRNSFVKITGISRGKKLSRNISDLEK